MENKWINMKINIIKSVSIIDPKEFKQLIKQFQLNGSVNPGKMYFSSI